MKKLTSLLFGFLFIPALSFSQQQDSLISKYNSLFYKEFKIEMEKADTLSIKPIFSPSIGLANMYKYDLNKDKITDIIEIYPLKYSHPNSRLEESKRPLFYIIDINGDGCIEYSELLIDENMNGLNGDEQFCDLLRPKKPTPIKL